MIKKIFSPFLLLTLLTFFLNNCGIYKRSDVKDNPVEVDKRVQKNIEEGKGFRIFDMNKNNSGTFDFASSNELWRASLEIIDFIPLVSANYSGGIIITDWYNDSNSSGQSVKISVRFLSNEVRSDALDIKIFTKNCDTSIDCKINENKGSLVTELTKSILKKATIYEKQGVNKRKSYENAALD